MRGCVSDQRHHGVLDQRHEVGAAHVVGRVGLGRHVGCKDAADLAGLGDHDGHHGGVLEQFALQLLAHHVVRRDLERERREMRGRDAVLEPVLAKRAIDGA